MSSAAPERLAADDDALTTLQRAVRSRAETNGAAPAFTFVDYGSDRAGRSHTLSYAELDRRATALAARLLAHCRPGDRVALLVPHSLHYLVGFLGCLYARTVAVPLHPPEPFRSDDRITAVLADAEPTCVLTTRAIRETVLGLMGHGDGAAHRTILCVDEPAGRSATAHPGPGASADASEDDVAYLQYTSGSTRTPRGVLISNANLMTAARQSAEQSQLVSGDVLVSWLPYFHDMGLITGVAMPLVTGAHAVHLTPMAFIQQPYRWLKLISEHRAVWTAAPNFALDLCVRRVTPEQRRDLRLETLHTLCNGSEQVRSESVRAFARAFADCGFGLSGHAPGYGLAEATLGVTSALDGALVRPFDRDELAEGRVRPTAEDDPRAWQLVGCGVPMPGVRVRIADPRSGCEQLPGHVGEIWVAGPNVAQGYWRRPIDSEEVFGAVLTLASGERTGAEWLRTRDLGFLHEGELFVTGRMKDLVVIDGRNHYAADIEMSVEEALAQLKPAGSAAFPYLGPDGERLVVAVELRRAPRPRAFPHRSDAQRAVRLALATCHGVEPHEVLFVRGGTIPRTSSGKVRRRLCADRYAKGNLDDLETNW